MNEYLLKEGFGLTETSSLADSLYLVLAGRVSDRKMGICFNWQTGYRFSVANCYELVNQLSVGWPDHSGNESYPIPKCWHSPDLLWEGKQLELRQSLMSYMLGQLVEYRESL